MANTILKKLDGRYTGHATFMYRVDVSGHGGDKDQRFVQIRNWMIDTYGKSMELEYFTRIKAYNPDSELLNPKWAWTSADYGRYIYLQNDDIMSWFSLKWL